MHQSDTGRIQDDHYPVNTREVRVGYGYPVSGYPLQFLRALCLCVVPTCVVPVRCSCVRFNFLVPARFNFEV
jgi:hypothetical protein